MDHFYTVITWNRPAISFTLPACLFFYFIETQYEQNSSLLSFFLWK